MTERFKTSLAEHLTAFSSPSSLSSSSMPINNKSKARSRSRSNTRTRARTGDRTCTRPSISTKAGTRVHPSTPVPAPVLPVLPLVPLAPLLRVVKEDLVVVDGDLSDYPTEHALDIGNNHYLTLT